MPQAAQTRRYPPGQTRAGRGGGTHRRDLLACPKWPKVSVLASSISAAHGQLPIRFMARSSSACTGSPLRCLSQASTRRSLSHATARAEDIYAQLARQKLHRSSRKSRGTTSRLRNHRSIAGQVPAVLPNLRPDGDLGTWTSQARPHLPQAHQQPTFFSKLSVMFRSSLDTSIKPLLCPRKNRGPRLTIV